MDQNEIQRIVNPSYTTGKGCLAMLLAAGDPDAARLARVVDLSELSRGSAPQSDEAKEIAHLRKELRDYKDAVEVLKKAIGILGK